MADYVTDSKIGIDLTAVYASTSAGSITVAPHKPGDRVNGNNNSVYMFARAASDTTAGMVVAFGSFADSAASSDAARMPTLQAVPANTTNAVVGGVAGDGLLGIAVNSCASSYSTWWALQGTALRFNCKIACQPNVPLYLTSTAGSVDDATVSSGYIAGLTIYTSATSASAPWGCAQPGFKVVHAQTSSS